MRRGKFHLMDVGDTLIDAANLPQFDCNRLEGRIVAPIKRWVIAVISVVILLLFGVVAGRLWYLQIMNGEVYAEVAGDNRIVETKLFADRGIITDRKGETLAWNEEQEDRDIALRKYTAREGLDHLLGFIKYPTRDKHGYFIRDDYEGREGVERAYQGMLQGKAGTAYKETDVHGKTVSSSVREEPTHGESIRLTIDAALTETMHKWLKDAVDDGKYLGGAGVIMDVHTGELIAMTSYPEYDSQIMSDGTATTTINGYNQDSVGKPFMNRNFQGAFTPGSIVKVIMALAALNEGVVDANKSFVSTGELRVQSPFDPTQYSVFRDRMPLGVVDVRRAIAVSSNIYFYYVGGGYGSQKGIGIDKIEAYSKAFGLGTSTGIDLPGEISRPVPGISWKKQVFPNEPWRLGDTYHTVIGQYGFQVTPIQMVRVAAAIATNGVMVKPHVHASSTIETSEVGIDIPDRIYKIVQEGMRMTVTDGTAPGLKFPGQLEVTAKSGTAEVGARNQKINSWIIGYWPYKNPKYAFAVSLESAPGDTHRSAVSVMQRTLEYILKEAPEYTK